jgi:radical SAM protein with 4Fe4S-binding SPASM domain
MKEKLDYISLEVTSECNLNCKYCYNIWKIPGTQDFIPFNSYKLARKTLNQLFKIADVRHVTFTGGEPFRAQRFAELVLFTRLKKKTVTIITNGSGTDESGYRQMIDLGVSLFELPIHSYDPRVHDYMTETKGSHQNSVESVKYLKNNGVNVVVVIVITKANFDHLSQTLEFIRSIGIKNIMLNRFNIGGRGIDEKKNLMLSKEQLNYAFKQASLTGEELGLSLSSNVCTPMCFVNPEDYKNIYFGTCSPDVKKRPLTLDLQGNLRFCNHSPTILGNIFIDRLDQILYSGKTEEWSKHIPDYCDSCELFTKCMGGCRAAGEQLHLSLKFPDPILLVETIEI